MTPHTLLNAPHILTEIAVSAALLLLWVATGVSILRSRGYSVAGQVGWIIVALVFPLLGPMLWWSAGRRRQRRRVTMNSWWT